MSDAEAIPDAGEAGQTPGGVSEPAVNEEDNNNGVDPNDPLTGYKEALPVPQSAPEMGGGAVVTQVVDWSI